MTRLRRCLAGLAALCAAACAGQPDHFYTLNTLPAGGTGAPAPMVHVRLQVTVPSMVDRAEMVLNTSVNGISILDHERWAAPLADQVSQTLARDLEARRGDVIVGDRGFDRPASPPVTVRVDIVTMSAQRGARVGMEAHWRVEDAAAGLDLVGSDSFEAPLAGDSFAAVARGYSETLSALAGRLAQELPHR